MQRIAMISDHASPLTPAGSVDNGGQNIYVAQIARRLCALGHHVDVFTRRDGPHLPPVFESALRQPHHRRESAGSSRSAGAVAAGSRPVPAHLEGRAT